MSSSKKSLIFAVMAFSFQSAFAQNPFADLSKSIKQISQVISAEDANVADSNQYRVDQSKAEQYCSRVISNKEFNRYVDLMERFSSKGIYPSMSGWLMDDHDQLDALYRKEVRKSDFFGDIDALGAHEVIRGCYAKLKETKYRYLFVDSLAYDPYQFLTNLDRSLLNYNPNNGPIFKTQVHLLSLFNPVTESKMNQTSVLYNNALSAQLGDYELANSEKEKRQEIAKAEDKKKELSNTMIGIYSQWEFLKETLPAHKEKCTFLKRWGAPGYSPKYIEHVTKRLPSYQQKLNLCHQAIYGKPITESDYRNWLRTDKMGAFYGMILNVWKQSGTKLEVPRTNKDVNQCVDSESEALQAFMLVSNSVGFDNNKSWCEKLKSELN